MILNFKYYRIFNVMPCNGITERFEEGGIAMATGRRRGKICVPNVWIFTFLMLITRLASYACNLSHTPLPQPSIIVHLPKQRKLAFFYCTNFSWSSRRTKENNDFFFSQFLSFLHFLLLFP